MAVHMVVVGMYGSCVFMYFLRANVNKRWKKKLETIRSSSYMITHDDYWTPI